jgi:RimJ/RimL family protein N-acetyltransferase
MAYRVQDRALLWEWLNRDPVYGATVIHRVFFRAYKDVYVDRKDGPRAVLAANPPDGPGEELRVALQAADPEAAKDVLDEVPSGPYFVFLADAPMADVWKDVVSEPTWQGVSILYRMDPADFVDRQKHAVAPVREEHAGTIAKVWSPDWDATAYVASRIREGLSYGVYVDGELVAWDMSHFETDKVVMMGFLHTLEGHRGHGYATSAASAMVKAVLDKGKIPACHVFTDNEPSIRLTERLGFRRVGLQVWADGVRP